MLAFREIGLTDTRSCYAQLTRIPNAELACDTTDNRHRHVLHTRQHIPHCPVTNYRDSRLCSPRTGGARSHLTALGTGSSRELS